MRQLLNNPAAVLIGLVVTFSVSAQEVSGNELRKLLRADEIIAADQSKVTIELLTDANNAMGYIRGVSDTLAQVIPKCVPGNSTPGQKLVIVRKFLDEHPELWHLSGASIAVVALRTAFSCGQAPKQ